MARSCGLRIGDRRFELVVLEGSAKKHKIAAYATGELPKDGDDDTIAAAANALRQACKQHNVPADNIGLAIDTGLAAFRTLKVPFADRGKIEEVIKFEAESLLPQWSIDDVVIDFHVLDSTNESSELLITAVPKEDLKRDLAICEKAGVEPLEAELETSAMVNAALQAGRCGADMAQILVHIGEHSTAVVVMDGGRVREMRAIRIGALTHDAPAAASAEGEAAEGDWSSGKPEVAIDPADVARRLDQANKRIRRELGRTVSAARTTHPIETIYVCGFELPGLGGSTILDVPVRTLDVFEADGGAPSRESGSLVVAYGVAIGRLGGGVLKPSLRREELRYAGAFEKIELPLAVMSIVALAFVCVWLVFVWKERDILVEHKLAFWRDSTCNYLMGDARKGLRGALEFPSDQLAKYATLPNLAADTTRTDIEKMRFIQGQIASEIKKLEKDLGQDTEITQPQSALRGAAIVLGVLEAQIKDGAVPSLRLIDARYMPSKSAGKPEHVRVLVDLTYFADDTSIARGHYEDLKSRLQRLPGFLDFEEKSTTPIENGRGINVTGTAIAIDVSKSDAASKPDTTKGA